MFSTKEALAAFIQQFEKGTLPIEEWTHSAHLTMALWYLSHFPEGEAISRIRTGIQNYNRHQGIQTTPTRGYHETLTLFWCKITQAFLASQPSTVDIVVLTRQFTAHYQYQQKCFLDYYSQEVVMSQEARQHWTEPNLKPLPEKVLV